MNSIFKSVRFFRLLKAVQEFYHSDSFDTGESKYPPPPEFKDKFDKILKDDFVKVYLNKKNERFLTISFHDDESILKKMLLDLGIKRFISILTSKFYDNICEKLYNNHCIVSNLTNLSDADKLLEKHYLRSLDKLMILISIFISVLSIFGGIFVFLGILVVLISYLFVRKYLYERLLSQMEKDKNSKLVKMVHKYDMPIQKFKGVFSRKKWFKKEIVELEMYCFGTAIQIDPRSIKTNSKKLLDDIYNILIQEIYYVSPY